MHLRKIRTGDREIMRKYRIQTESNTSFYNEEFDCGPSVGVLSYGGFRKKHQPNFGVSKREGMVSCHFNVHGLKELVSGA